MTTARMPFLRTLVLTVGLAAPLSLAACNLGEIPIGSNQDDISCNASSDCPAGDICVEQLCETCQPAGETCDGADNDCDGAIDEEPDLCPMGGTCVAGACQFDQGCMADSDCDPGQLCVGGTCQSGQMACMADSDCDPGQLCVNGTCQSGMCIPAPDLCDGVDNDCDGVVDEEPDACPMGGTCINGVCQVGQICMSSADCPPGQTCQNGMCAP